MGRAFIEDLEQLPINLRWFLAASSVSPGINRLPIYNNQLSGETGLTA
ncbi:MAG: hypothetical protein MI867_23685 [Pseudomonadales bacterium]|nr:hypothetical protein [Pseudomonadales bacterium]